MRIAPSPPVIERQAVSRLIDISVVTNGRDRGAVTHDINSVLQSTPLPLEYHAEVLGEDSQPMTAADLARHRRGDRDAPAPAGLARQLALRGRCPSMTPLVAAAGGVAGGSHRRRHALARIVVRGRSPSSASRCATACCSSSSYRRLEREAGESPSYAFVLDGSGERLVPVAMTAVVTLLIALTFIAFGSRPGQELAYPLAIAVFGGVLAGTASTLFAVPVLYARLAGDSTCSGASRSTSTWASAQRPRRRSRRPRERNRCEACESRRSPSAWSCSASRSRPAEDRRRARSRRARQDHEARRTVATGSR